jgi:hypothetical protein
MNSCHAHIVVQAGRKFWSVCEHGHNERHDKYPDAVAWVRNHIAKETE